MGDEGSRPVSVARMAKTPQRSRWSFSPVAFSFGAVKFHTCVLSLLHYLGCKVDVRIPLQN